MGILYLHYFLVHSNEIPQMDSFLVTTHLQNDAIFILFHFKSFETEQGKHDHCNFDTQVTHVVYMFQK